MKQDQTRFLALLRRVWLDWHVEDLVALLDVDRATVYRWFKGESVPSPRTAARLLRDCREKMEVLS